MESRRRFNNEQSGSVKESKGDMDTSLPAQGAQRSQTSSQKSLARGQTSSLKSLDPNAAFRSNASAGTSVVGATGTAETAASTSKSRGRRSKSNVLPTPLTARKRGRVAVEDSDGDEEEILPAPTKRKRRSVAVKDSDDEEEKEVIKDDFPGDEDVSLAELETAVEKAIAHDAQAEHTDDDDEYTVTLKGKVKGKGTKLFHSLHSFTYLNIGDRTSAPVATNQLERRFADQLRYGIVKRNAEAMSIQVEAKAKGKSVMPTLGRLVASKLAGPTISSIEAKIMPYLRPEAQTALSIRGWGWDEFCSIPAPSDSELEQNKFLYFKLYKYANGSIQPYTGIARSKEGGGRRLWDYEKVMRKKAQDQALSATQLSQSHIKEMHVAEEVAVRVVAIFPMDFSNVDLQINEGLATDWSQSMSDQVVRPRDPTGNDKRPHFDAEMYGLYQAAAMPDLERQISSVGLNRAHPFCQLGGFAAKTSEPPPATYAEQGSQCVCCLQDKKTNRQGSINLNKKRSAKQSKSGKVLPHFETLPYKAVVCRGCWQGLTDLMAKDRPDGFDRIALEKDFISEKRVKDKLARRAGVNNYSSAGSAKLTAYVEHGSRTMCCGRSLGDTFTVATLKLNSGMSAGTYQIPGLHVKASGLAYCCRRCINRFAKAVNDGDVTDSTDPIEGARWLRSQWADEDLENCPYSSSKALRSVVE